MKKLIIISALTAVTLFAEGLTDIAKQAAVAQAKSEATKTVNHEIDKIAGTTVKKSELKTEKKEEVKKGEAAEKTGKNDITSSLKEQAIDVAADQAHVKTGVEKGLAKEAIKSVVK